jgi:hypothetical protein
MMPRRSPSVGLGADYEFVGGGKSGLKKGTRGKVVGISVYIKKDGGFDLRLHFVPPGKSGHTISAKYFRIVKDAS